MLNKPLICSEQPKILSIASSEQNTRKTWYNFVNGSLYLEIGEIKDIPNCEKVHHD